MGVQGLSDAEYAVLSLLGEGVRHGYELDRLISERGLREWTEIGFSSVYFLLGKLEQQGLARPVAGRPAAGPRGAKSRKAFAITRRGSARLADITEQMLAVPNRVFPRVLLGMANWPVLDEPTAKAALERRREALAGEAARLTAVRDSQRPLPDFVEALFDYAIGQLRADMAWIERTQMRLETAMKIDFKKAMPTLYGAPRGEFVAVDVPPMQFVKIDGQGDPNSAPAFEQAVGWLFGVSYGMKFAAKARTGKDYVVPPLEGLWWADDPEDFVTGRKDRWRWTVMVMAPDFLDRSLFEAAVEKTRRKLGEPPATLRFEPLEEGPCLQTLHVGSYEAEGPVLARLHREVMPARGLTFAGPHHEIYLSDMRKTAPDKLKTILRQPVKPCAGRAA